MTESSGPVRALAARVLTYRGRSESFSCLAALFQALCGQLRDAGALPGVYPVLARIKQRILSQGAPLGADDVFAVAEAHNARLPGDPAGISETRLVLSVPGTGERLAYHREFVQNLRQTGRPAVTLSTEALGEVLVLVLQPRLYAAREQRKLLETELSPGAGPGALRVLDTVYRATFLRTIRKELCEPTVIVPVAAGAFHLVVDLKKTAHLTLGLPALLTPLLERLGRSPDLAAVLGTDDRLRQKVDDGLRQLTAALQDAARPTGRTEAAPAPRSAAAEVLEEL